MTTNTVAKKTEAIQAFHKSITFGTDAEKTIDLSSNDLADKIRRELAPVIRSRKWADAVEQYAQFVLDYPDSTTWAYFQGSVYFAYQVS